MISYNINGWSRDRVSVVLTQALCQFVLGLSASLMGPLYPAEAERHGAAPTEYGLVFGMFQLTSFLSSPVIGKFLPRIGVTRAVCAGLVSVGFLNIAFGTLTFLEKFEDFVALSLIIRIFTAIGETTFQTSSFTLVSLLSSTNVGFIMAVVKMSFGVGVIIGPIFGVFLFQAGGYVLPFACCGCLCIIFAISSYFILPKHIHCNSNTQDEEDSLGLRQAFSITPIVISSFSIFSAAISVAAFQATLERFLARFDPSQVEVGLIFVVYGASYALLNPVWGWLADRYSPKIVIMIGSLLVSGHWIIDPLPIFGIGSGYGQSVFSVFLTGLGHGSQLIASFSEALRSATAAGYSQNVSTCATISSIYTSSFSIGAFVGTIVTGTLFQLYGFDYAMLFPILSNLLVFLFTALGLFKCCFVEEKSIMLNNNRKNYGAINHE